MNVQPNTENQNGFKAVGMIIAIIIVVWILYIIIKKVVINNNTLSSPGNILSIKKQQIIFLNDRWSTRSQGKEGLSTQFTTTPQPQQLLINTSVFATRLTGLLGPYTSGVFDEDNATRIALSSGSRCLILEIDYDNNIYAPKLIYRDGWGMKQSINTANLTNVAKSIAARAFTPQNDGVPSAVAQDPLFVVVYFVRAPNQGTEKLEYMRYLGAVAEQLAPLRPLLLAQTPQGDYRRQALESHLFFTDYHAFQNKIILLTNADTSGFRNLQALGLAGELGENQDLDFMTHARLYSRESPSPFGITSSPISSIKPAAVITSPGYWLSTPTDRASSAIELTKEAWTIVMHPISTQSNQLDQKPIDNLFNIYGIQSIPTTLFADPASTDEFTGKDKHFSKAVWVAKPPLLQYVPPVAISIKNPYPQANSGGGAVVAPKL